MKNKKETTLFSSDLLRDTTYENGDSVYFLLFPYSNPDMIFPFKGVVLKKRLNIDMTYEYAIRITHGYEKREFLKDFFNNNWFKFYSKGKERYKMFSFVEQELVQELSNEKFSFTEYCTFFKNSVEKFDFWINETFTFDSLTTTLQYLGLLNQLALVKHLKTMHDICVTYTCKNTSSAFRYNSTEQFVIDFAHIIKKLIQDLGDEYIKKYTENGEFTTKKNYAFFLDFILQTRKITSLEISTKRRKNTSSRAIFLKKSTEKT